jgi:hypothetical protein
MIDDRYLSPLLLQMAVFSAVDATERGAGEALSIRREGGNSEGLPTKSTTIAKTAAIQ